MKKISTTAIFIFGTLTSAFAQKQTDALPYNKEKLDSMFRVFPKLNQPFEMPAPKENATPFPNTLFLESPAGFEANNPGTTVINKTSRGTVYNMPLDNMAVLVSNMQAVEKIPVNKLQNGDKMPNPLKKEKKY